MKRKLKLKLIILPALIFCILPSISISQSSETGAITGKVTDEENNLLPGVRVTLSGTTLMGMRTEITNAKGSYRFPALPPGLYTIKTELAEFTIVICEKIRLHTTNILTVDIQLNIATEEGETTIINKSPVLDVRSSESASITLADEVLRNIPTSQILYQTINLAPGVTQDSAYGASESTGISYQADGLNVSDPESGSAWVFTDYNIVEEAKIMGIGLPAEYGAFTGLIFNTITKSGGNRLSGHLEFIYQQAKKGFWSTENNGDYIDDFPSLESPLQGMYDVSYHLGGPIQTNKVWFFTGAHLYQIKTRPIGFSPDEKSLFETYNQPSALFKLSFQPSSKLNLTAFFEYDNYIGKNKNANYLRPTPETTFKQKAPDYVGNISMTSILSSSTFFTIRGGFFIGYTHELPQIENWETTPAVFSYELWQWQDNSNYWFKLDRNKYQANAALSHYTENFIGKHDFKFGADLEFGSVKNRLEYTGYVEGIGSNTWIYDWYGILYAYQYEGYDTQTSYLRTEFFAQDSWSIFNNFTINFGARFSLAQGFVKDNPSAVFKTNHIAPRVGFAWDIFNNHSTVIKGHWGQFSEAMFTAFHDRLLSSEHYSDSIGYYYDDWNSEWIELTRFEPQDLFIMSDSDQLSAPYKRELKHPYLEQYSFGLEQELFKDAYLGIHYINRTWKNIIGIFDTLGKYDEITVNDPLTDATYTVYDRTNPEDYNFVIANINNKDPGILGNPYRKYWAFEAMFNKRFSNRWQMFASYVYSKCTGTIDNGFAHDIGWSVRSHDPNSDYWLYYTYDPNFWINAEGSSSIDPTHMFKLQGTIVLPLDIWLNVYFQYITGNTYSRSIRIPSYIGQGRKTIFSEARGSRRYPDRMTLDLRVEKTFMLANRYRVGFLIDIFNVLNDNAVTDWGSVAGVDWWPHSEFQPAEPGPDGHVIYNLVSPRRIRIGVRVFF